MPRRWTHLPTDVNFAGAGVAHTTGDILFDPVMQIEEATVSLTSYLATYTRTFELWGRSTRIDLQGRIMDGEWKGLLEGEPASTARTGLGDPSMRVAIGLIGAPPLRGKDYQLYRKTQDVETLVAAGLFVGLPLGEYDEDRLINLGANRFCFRPELGLVHSRGKWTGELTGSLWIWTDNDEYWQGRLLEQDPMLSGQLHLIYTPRPGLWISGSGAYGTGAEIRVDGTRKDSRTENLMGALNVGLALSRQVGIKLSWVTARTQYRLGSDTDTLALALSYLW